MYERATSDIIQEINRLKREKNVTILAHYYMPPDIQRKEEAGGIADYVGDSLGLSMQAQQTRADSILFCGVRFMAETALLVNPHKKVYMPDPTAGCSLASSITAAQIRELKQQYPGVPVMGYINTYAETKTELDICCTSRNALSIIQSMDADTLLFVPDLYMGQNLSEAVAKTGNKKLILWNGTCEVHEQFNNKILDEDEEAEVLLHWEVPNSTVKRQLATRKGVVGSTGEILAYVKQSTSKKFVLASECDLGVALQEMNGDKEFITPCIKCTYMKQNTLQKVLDAMNLIGHEDEVYHRITLDEETINKARVPVLKMLQYN